LNLVKIVPKLNLDKKRNKVFVKIEKSPKIGMEICGVKEGDFDFKAKETFDDEDTKLALVHFPSQEVLPRDAINVEYIDGSDSAHSLDDEKESRSLLINKTMIKNVQLDDLDTKLKFGSKVKLSTRGGFKELDVPNLSKSLSQIEKVMDQSKLKKGKRNAYYPIFEISPRKTRRCELTKASKSTKKSR
jgi:hypothetical protein